MKPQKGLAVSYRLFNKALVAKIVYEPAETRRTQMAELTQLFANFLFGAPCSSTAQEFDDPSAKKPVRPDEWARNPGSLCSFLLKNLRIRCTCRLKRTHGAEGARRADHCAKIHQGMIPLISSTPWKNRCCQFPHRFCGNLFSSKKISPHHAILVRVDRCGVLLKRKRGDCPCSVWADPGEAF